MNVFHCITAIAILWVACFVCCGCAPVRPVHLPDDDRRAVSAFAQAWEGAGLPSIGGCHVDAARVVHTTTAAQFERECGAHVEDAASCITQVTQQVGMRVEAIPRVVLRPGLASIDTNGGGPIVHELIHWGAGCVRLRPGSSAQDPQHTDPRLWAGASKDPAIRAVSVQGRAYWALTPDQAP